MRHLFGIGNEKVSKMSGIKTYTFGLEPHKTCPTAKACKAGCFGNAGNYKFKVVLNCQRQRQIASRLPSFVFEALTEIDERGIKRIRLHDTGDFYSLSYTLKWLVIALLRPHVLFYAYTKRVYLFKTLAKLKLIPENLIITYSYGGTQDRLINPRKDRHSLIFKTEQDLINAGYVNGSIDDAIAANGDTLKIGLVYHGRRAWDKTGLQAVLEKALR